MNNILKGKNKGQEQVKKGKNIALKTRLDSLITSSGMSHSEFYDKVGISRQYYYLISWGLDPCPYYLQIKIAEVLNKPVNFIFKETKVDQHGEVKSSPETKEGKNEY